MLFGFSCQHRHHRIDRRVLSQCIDDDDEQAQWLAVRVRLLRGDGAGQPSQTELAARSLAARLELPEPQIRRDLERGTEADFGQTQLYARVFELATRLRRTVPPRALVPRIRLQGPKITRTLTTEWFAQRVDGRFQRCLARGSGPDL